MADEPLLRLWREAAREIADRAYRMGTAASRKRAYAQLLQIRDVLEKLRRGSGAYIDRVIRGDFAKADSAAVRALAAQGKEEIYSTFARPNEEAVNAIIRGATGKLDNAADGIGLRADEYFRRTQLSRRLDSIVQRKVARGTAQGEATRTIAQRIADRLRGEFASGRVHVINKNGVSMRFDADYYAGLVAQNERRQAMTSATITRTAQNGEDLVVVSSNFSTVGDFCDAYRGRIYSLSGTHPVAAPLAAIPNGGPPLHPSCRHSVHPWIAEFHDEAETAARCVTDPRFLNVDGRTAAKRWKGMSRGVQAQLRHAPDKWAEGGEKGYETIGEMAGVA